MCHSLWLGALALLHQAIPNPLAISRRLLLFLALLHISDDAWAQATVEWVVGGSPNWEINENWSTGTVPTSTDYISLSSGISLNGARTVGRVDIRSANISGGTLGITQTDPFGISLFVSSTTEGARFDLRGEGTTLSSNARAVIGAFDVGAYHAMGLDAGTTWFHNGLIELGANGSVGQLSLNAGAVLSGGLSNAPNMVVHTQHGDPRAPELSTGQSGVRVGELFAPQSAPATLSLTDLTLDGFMTVVRNSTVFAENIYIDNGAQMNYAFGIGGYGRVAVTNALTIAENTSGQFGTYDMEASDLLSAQSILAAGKTDSLGGIYLSGAAVVGTEGGDRTAEAVVLGRDVGSRGYMDLTNTGTGDVTIHGTTVVGKAGSGGLYVRGARTLTINGDLNLASANSTADASLDISGGSTVAVQNVYVGTNASDWDYGGSPYSPFPAGRATINIETGSTLNVTGWRERWESYNPYTGQLQVGYYEYAGVLSLGANDHLNGSGTIAFTSAQGGTLSAIGTINPGYATNTGRVVEIGEIFVQGNLKLNNGLSALTPTGATLRIDLAGTGVGQFDVLRVTGDVDFRNATLEIGLKDLYNESQDEWLPYDPVSGTTYNFLVIGGSLTGMFSNLVDLTGRGLTLANLSSTETGGLMLTIPASAVPEPSTYAVLAGLVALGCVVFVRQRSK